MKQRWVNYLNKDKVTSQIRQRFGEGQSWRLLRNVQRPVVMIINPAALLPERRERAFVSIRASLACHSTTITLHSLPPPPFVSPFFIFRVSTSSGVRESSESLTTSGCLFKRKGKKQGAEKQLELLTRVGLPKDPNA